MILHALVTGCLRQLAQGLYALGCPEFHTVRRLEVLRALRQCNLEARRSLSQRWELRPMKGLTQSWDPKWTQNLSQRQNQNLKWNQSQSPTQSQSMTQSLNQTSRQKMSLKV